MGAATVVSDQGPTVETTAGSVRGYRSGEIHTFKGVPYGGPTGGANRFMPPTKAELWSGVRSTLAYGYLCPQIDRAPASDETRFMFAWDEGRADEDCLNLNVWTPGLDSSPGNGGRRPVMVWFHGGGYVQGSSQELAAYDGENLSRRGDVVVVSVNHRLGVLGFLNLATVGGEKYAASANAGQLDLVASLEWVRDNIANFGGDPGNVTIFGQSGGGVKVAVLMAMPSAKGLFHRALVQSGSALRMTECENSARLAGGVLSELGIDASQLDQLHSLPVRSLVEASAAALQKVPAGAERSRLGMGWQPTVDGGALPAHPFEPAAPAMSADIPMMIGTTKNERALGLFTPKLEVLTDDEVKVRLTSTFGERTERVYSAYRSNFPSAKPIELWEMILSPRTNAVKQAERKTGQGAAPAYLYWFARQSPILDGRARAFHCSELPFMFNNTDRAATMTGGGPEARALGELMSDAWISFARSGNPNHGGMANWPAFTPEHGETMVFDTNSKVVNDPDREARLALEDKAR